MASLFDKITDLFKPKTDEIKPVVSQINTSVAKAANPWKPVAQAPTVQSAVSNTGPFTQAKTSAEQTKPAPVFKVDTEEEAANYVKGKFNAFKAKLDEQPFYTPKKGGLASDAMLNDRKNGNDWKKADAATQEKVYAYYEALDNPEYAKWYKDVASLYSENDAEKFKDKYSEGYKYLSDQLDAVAKEHGKDSAEYWALERFIQDYNKLGRHTTTTYTTRQSDAASQQLDSTIRAVYAPVIRQDDFYDVAKKGEEKAEGKLFGGRKFKNWTENASDLQKSLLYYVYEKDGEKAAENLYQKFLGDTLAYANAAADFASDIMNNDELGRFFEANGANWASAMAQSFGGMQQTFTNTKSDPNDKTLTEGYTISDSVDDFLHQAFGDSLNEAALESGAEMFDMLGMYIDGETWYEEAKKEASDYQKQILGLMAISAQSPEAAKETWEEIKKRSDEIWQTVNGSGTLADKKGSVEGQLYRDYLGLSGETVMGDKTVAQIVWDTAQTTRAQYPQILANVALTAAGLPMAGRILGNVVMGTSVYGNEYKQALRDGYTPEQAIKYAAAQAGMEFGVGMLLDGVAPYAGALTGQAGTKIINSIANPYLKAVALMGVRGLGEGTEEYIQEIMDPLLRNWIFHEENEFNPFTEEAGYSFLLGGLSAMLMSPGNVYADINVTKHNAQIGKALNSMNSMDKIIDTILNKPVKSGSKEQLDLYEDIRKKAQMVKDGKLKLNDVLSGELMTSYAKAGGDVSFLTNPDTVSYTKEQITLNDMVAGAKSVLTELGADAEMANDIAKLAMGQALSEEAQAKINASKEAQQVLSELQGDLDMKSNNALARAARMTTVDGALNKVYTAMQQYNPDKHVVTPSAQYLMNEGGLDVKNAEKIGNVVDKVLDGIEITEAEAKLLKASSPAIRGLALKMLNIELSEYDNAATVMSKLNDVAKTNQKVQDMQAGVKQSTKVTPRRAVIPAAQTQGGVATNDQRGTGSQTQGTQSEGIPGAQSQSTGSAAEGSGVQSPGHLDRRGQRSREDSGNDGAVHEKVSGVIPGNKLDEKQRVLNRQLVSQGAGLVEFIYGDDSYTGWDAERGVYVIAIRTDGQFTQEQYAAHEPVHLWVRCALSRDYRYDILDMWRENLGEDFQKAYDGLYELYENKGYLDGFDAETAEYIIIEETLAMSRGAQEYSFFDFAKTKELADDFIEAFNLEAIGTGDFSNPAVQEAYNDGRINKQYYERQGFAPDEGGLDVGTPENTNRSADEEENYGETNTDEGRVRGSVAERESSVSARAQNRNPLPEPKKNIRRKSAAQRRGSREVHEAEVELIEEDGHNVIPYEEVPEQFRRLGDSFLEAAPDSDVSYYWDDSDEAYYAYTLPSFDPGEDGGLFLNLAKLTQTEELELDGYTLDTILKHEKGHFWLDKAGGLGNRAFSALRSYLMTNINEYSQLNDIYSRYVEWCSDAIHDAKEELICDIFGGRSIAFEMRAPGLWSKVKRFVDNYFEKNTEYGLQVEDQKSFSADEDPEYYQSIGLIDTDGSTAAFTDNINGLHEELLNQIKGHEGEDAQDFIKRGGVRVKPGYGIEVNGDIMPTVAQFRMIDKVVRYFDGEDFNIDYNINGTIVGTKTLTGADINEDKVYDELRRFYNSRKREKALSDKLQKYTALFGLPVKDMRQAYDLARMFIKHEGPDPDYQEIIDTYEGQRYSADEDILNPESENYLGPDLGADTLRNAQIEDVYSNQDVWMANDEVSTDEDAIGESLSVNDEDARQAEFNALMTELEEHPEREEEIWKELAALQEREFNKTKHVDEAKQAPKKKTTSRAKAVAELNKEQNEANEFTNIGEAEIENKMAEEKPKAKVKVRKKTPTQMAFQPKAETEEPAGKTDEAKSAPETTEEQTPRQSEAEALQKELEANPDLAYDPDFLARVSEVARDLNEKTAAAKAFDPAEAEETEETNKPIRLKDSTVYTKKTGEWWKRIGKSDKIEIRRRRSDRNTFDIRFTDKNGKTVTYDDVSPSMLVSSFADLLKDRELAKQRVQALTDLAATPSTEWSTYENTKPVDEKAATAAKKTIQRDRDNYGRKIPVKLADRMAKSTVRDKNGALISTYRLAPANGVHNARLPGRVSYYVERPAAANTMRGMNGVEAYGQPDKAAYDRLDGWLKQLSDPKTTEAEARVIRSQIAKEEREMREYTSGVTRLDPWRPGFEFATPQNIINGKSLLEVYLDIRKPKVIDAKGKGEEFIQKTVSDFIQNPDNRAGLFDENNDPIGPYDGFKFTNARIIPEGSTLGGEDLDLDTVYVTLRNNQAKSTYNTDPTDSDFVQYSVDEDFDTGYTEGTLEDSILKIMLDKDEDRALAALSEFLAQFLQTGVLPQMEDPKTKNIFQPRVTPGQRKIIEDRLAELSKKYGTIEEGENPTRQIALPRKTGPEDYVRRAFRTAAESKHTPDRAVPTIEREIVMNEGATYQRITDKAATAYADREMRRKGYDRVEADWEGKLDVEAGKLTKNDVALGELVYIEAVKAGDMETAMKTLVELAEIGTTAGQVVQAFRMLKNMPKSYQLYYFQRVVNRLNRQFSKRIERGKMEELHIDKKYAKAVLNAKNQEEIDEAVEALIQHVADQIPATLSDKWNAWRYFAMLGNPKTHIRNYLGNAIFTPAKFMKDLIAAGLETTFIKDVNKRQTSVKGLLDRAGTRDYRKFAEEDFEGIKDELQSGGKYNPTNRILEARRMFKFKPLESLRRWSGDLLEKEDGVFLRKHYVNAMTNFLATRGVSIEELTNNKSKIGARTLNAARQYAFTEAQKATYRDASQVANALSQLKKVPVLGTLVEGMLPFTKTPINILKRGIEYSPVGLLKTIALESGKLKSGDISANEYIDNLSAGLTGTGIVALGVFLSSLGILRGGGDDDEKQADFDKLQGYQDYSINLGDNFNYTIDWMAPGSLPLFVGNALYEEMATKNGLSVADITNILTAIAEPITQLSMLSGVNDALKTAKWDENPISSVAMAMASGYASQGIPTLFAQLSRSFSPDRKTTYVDKNSDVPQAMQRWWQTNVMGKTPLNANRADYIDAWGRKDTTQSFALRLIENMLSPGYANAIQTTPVDEELQRLASATGTSVLMSSAEKSIEYNNETHNLTAEQYATYAKARGDATYAMLTELFNSAAYQHGMDDEAKAKAVGYIKSYGNSLGKAAVFTDYENDDDNWARKCDGDSNRMINMALLKAKASEAGITAGNNGEFYSLIINSNWLGPVEQGYAIAQQYTTTSEKAYVRKGGPTFELTKERKEQMYEYYRMIFPEYYLELTNTQKWQTANNEKKVEMLSDLRKDVGTVAKVWLAQTLTELGVPSDY